MEGFFASIIGVSDPIIQTIIGHLPIKQRLETAPFVSKKWAYICKARSTHEKFPLPSAIELRVALLIYNHILCDGIFSGVLRTCMPCIAAARRLPKRVEQLIHSPFFLDVDGVIPDFTYLLHNGVPRSILDALLCTFSVEERADIASSALYRFPLHKFSRMRHYHGSICNDDDYAIIRSYVLYLLSIFDPFLGNGEYNEPYIVIQRIVNIMEHKYGMPMDNLSETYTIMHLETGPDQAKMRRKKKLKR